MPATPQNASGFPAHPDSSRLGGGVHRMHISLLEAQDLYEQRCPIVAGFFESNRDTVGLGKFGGDVGPRPVPASSVLKS
jgi:hypothetical protein